MSGGLDVTLGLYNTLSSDDSPLRGRDKALVPLLTAISHIFSDFAPEEFVGASLVAVAVIIATFASQCGARGGSVRRGGFSLAILSLVLGIFSFEVLKVPMLDQDPELYDALPLGISPKVPGIGSHLECDGDTFKDAYGRVLLLRGVNLGGDTKIPTFPEGSTWRPDSFGDAKTVSFIGRPFPLSEADEHLARLRSWGFNFLRFLVTWEAIEHEGPGIYDTDYLEYLQAVVRKCAEHEISVFIDPHQDVWSRWTGGDGAPVWTLDMLGFNVSSLSDSAAAFTHQEFGDPYPRMIWPTNYNRLATATMFTLFFAGNTYAPNTKVGGVSAQEFLQGHYIKAIAEVAKYLKDEPNVLGYDTLNEPSNGYVGLDSLYHALFPAPLGWFMSALDGMRLGAGETVSVPRFTAPLLFNGTEKLNVKGQLAWKSLKQDIWQNEGVWKAATDKERAKVLKPSHFALNAEGKPVNFMRDFMAPFFDRFREAIHKHHPSAVIFAEGFIDPNKPAHDPAPTNMNGGPKVAWAPHFYDGLTLILKRFRPWVALDLHTESPVFGKEAADLAISKNLAKVRDSAVSLAGQAKGAPVIVGEVGIPMDLERDENGVADAYKTGDYSAQIQALDRTMRGLEDNLLSFTLWNYATTNSHERGDQWNGEDLSLFSRDDQKVPADQDLHSGGRALQAAVRPYPMKICGTPLYLHFDPLSSTRRFEFTFAPGECKEDAPTVIFVPSYQYPLGFEFKSSSSQGTAEIDQKNHVILFSHPSTTQKVTLTIESSKPFF